MFAAEEIKPQCVFLSAAVVKKYIYRERERCKPVHLRQAPHISHLQLLIFFKQH